MAKIAEIIKYEGDNSTFIWKHPLEDFNSLTQLIVHESQEAIFFMNGQALDLFGPGRYTLETQNIPFLSKLLNRITGDKTPFHCEVYFINKTEQMAIKWGTDSKVEYIEPFYRFPVSIGASGEMSLRADDSRKLLLKLVGTENYLSQQKLISYFRAFLMTKVKSYIAQVIKVNNINIFEIDEKLAVFSENIKNLLLSDFADYGIVLEQFFVTNIVKPDGNKEYEKFKQLHFSRQIAQLEQERDLIYAQTEAQKIIIDSQAIATKRAQEGYTYQQERGFDVASEVAKNEAIGQYTNLGVGLGTMAGVGGAVAGTLGGALNNVIQNNDVSNSNINNDTRQELCTKCSTPLPKGSKFCLNCGEKVVSIDNEDKIVCPQCGSIVKKGKFCLECGFKFSAVCPKCGFDVPNGAKFCFECGTQL